MREKPSQKKDSSSADYWRNMYAEFGGRLFGLAFSYLHEKNAAKETVQEAFASLYRATQKRESIAKPFHYLLRAVRNQCLNAKFRGRKKTAALEDWNLEPVSVRPGPATLALNRELADQVGDALGALPEKNREVIYLYIYQELTFDEIKDLLGRTLGSIQHDYYAGLEQLKKLLGDLS